MLFSIAYHLISKEFVIFFSKSIKNICEHFIDSCFLMFFPSFFLFSFRKHIVFSTMSKAFHEQMTINKRKVKFNRNWTIFIGKPGKHALFEWFYEADRIYSLCDKKLQENHVYLEYDAFHVFNIFHLYNNSTIWLK